MPKLIGIQANTMRIKVAQALNKIKSRLKKYVGFKLF
jgi:hypothetical protein